MSKHHLHEINLEHQVAFCSVCGATEIYISKSRAGKPPKVICINRLQEMRAASKQRRNELQRLQPDWKPPHSLSGIDIEKMTAICSVCGPTDIRKLYGKDPVRYVCATKERQIGRKYRRNAYTPRISSPLHHYLSNIDEENKTALCSICGLVEIYIWQGKRKMGRRCSNASVEGVPGTQRVRKEINTNMINRYKVEHGCSRCGFNADINRLHLHRRNLNNKVPKIEKLLKLKREDLMQELESCEVLCVDCYRPSMIKMA